MSFVGKTWKEESGVISHCHRIGWAFVLQKVIRPVDYTITKTVQTSLIKKKSQLYTQFTDGGNASIEDPLPR